MYIYSISQLKSGAISVFLALDGAEPDGVWASRDQCLALCEQTFFYFFLYSVVTVVKKLSVTICNQVPIHCQVRTHKPFTYTFSTGLTSLRCITYSYIVVVLDRIIDSFK